MKMALAAIMFLSALPVIAPAGELAVGADEQIQASQGKSRKLALSAITWSHEDGVRGYKVFPVLEGPSIEQPEPLRKTFAHFACNAAVFGLVELDAAQPFIGANGIGVFTKYQFRVLDDWRARPPAKGGMAHLIMDGGEVEFEGAPFRVDNPYARYKAGAKYILAAGRADEAGSQKTIFEIPAFIEVIDGLVYPAPGAVHFAPGSTLGQAKATVLDAVKQEGCAASP